jgi:CubicO group peptidase (beta-lactamase class C family)
LTVDGSGTAVNSGGVCACLRDYARLGQLIADAGAGIVITVLASQPESLDPRRTRVHRDFATAVNDRLAPGR